jgi:L-seryl-tRNA(Ser) seleniumtransferase
MVSAEEVTAEKVAPWVVTLVEHAARPSLRRVVNALGVVGHTNLGRALLPQEAVRALTVAAASYTDLEIDLDSGARGSRQDHVRDILCTLTGAEDALVVNNNAAAVLLALAATAHGGEVLVSRGQLVEIGDGFRIPDILRESGAQLVEVGTTNRTYLRDFEEAWTPRTRAVLRVHTSNYRIVGFTAEPGIAELVRLAEERDAVMIDDLGSGALGALEVFAEEPGVSESVSAGAHVVTFSGDKLLGGPQAGISVGRATTIEAMRGHPLARAVRIDKLGIAALDALLRLYLDPDAAVRRIPTLAMLAATQDEVAARAADLGERLRTAIQSSGVALADNGLEVVPSVARAGAGALPVTDVPSAALAVRPADGDAHGLAERLRRGEPAVLARIQDDRVLLDLRAVHDEELGELAEAVLRALQ